VIRDYPLALKLNITKLLVRVQDSDSKRAATARGRNSKTRTTYVWRSINFECSKTWIV